MGRTDHERAEHKLGPEDQARRTGSPGSAGQWWKAWVLLTGLGVTVLGWMAFPHGEPPAATDGISPQVSMSAENAPLSRRQNRPIARDTFKRHAHVAGDAAEARVPGPHDTHATFLTAMLHERHFRAMNTDVGVWLWSTGGRAPIILAGLSSGRRCSLHVSRTNSAGSGAHPL